MPELPKCVLFVCTGNTCRSPMAEGIYNDYARKNDLDTRAISAGIATNGGMPASFGAQAAMADMGIDISLHSSCELDKFMMQRADAVLCMQEAHAKLLRLRYPNFAQKISSLLTAAYDRPGDIDDPFGADEEVYKATARQISQAVIKYIGRHA